MAAHITCLIFPLFLLSCRCAIQSLWSEDYRAVTDHSQGFFQQAGLPWRCAYSSLSSGCQRSGIRNLENSTLPWSSKWVSDFKVCRLIQADLQCSCVMGFSFFFNVDFLFLLIKWSWEDISTALFFLGIILIQSGKVFIFNKDRGV